MAASACPYARKKCAICSCTSEARSLHRASSGRAFSSWTMPAFVTMTNLRRGATCCVASSLRRRRGADQFPKRFEEVRIAVPVVGARAVEGRAGFAGQFAAGRSSSEIYGGAVLPAPVAARDCREIVGTALVAGDARPAPSGSSRDAVAPLATVVARRPRGLRGPRQRRPRAPRVATEELLLNDVTTCLYIGSKRSITRWRRDAPRRCAAVEGRRRN